MPIDIDLYKQIEVEAINDRAKGVGPKTVHPCLGIYTQAYNANSHIGPQTLPESKLVTSNTPNPYFNNR